MKKIVWLLIPAVFMIYSCNKGCMDVNASNYDSGATKDNGDCTYKGTLTLWYQQSKSLAWENAGVTSLNLYVGDVFVDSYPVTDYWVTKPDCADAGTINASKNMGTQTTKDYIWELRDQNDNLLISDTWSATGGGCETIQVQ
ncbi:MAG: hypothetical protein HUJ25_04740 [Crocinitomicaceae bacterium]|nr:hypothetical protein [Crocinitomicaceae bacterium]